MYWLKENWFKITILIIIIIAIALTFIYETKHQQIAVQQQAVELNASCRKLALQKKADLIQNWNDKLTTLEIYTYEYKYNQKYKACILAYTGLTVFHQNGLIVNALSNYIFEIDNLSTGKSILSKSTSSGVLLIKARTGFYKMRAQYIESATPTK